MVNQDIFCNFVVDIMIQPKYIYLEEVGSTNDFLRQYEGDEEMVVAWTDFQHAGRGQGANHWESECGKNLTFSILIHPDNVLAHEQYIISMAVAATMRKYLSQVLSEEVYIKWPNDIYVGDQKVGGILIENRLAGNHIRDCVIGIGLNVNQTEFRSDAPNPVSMAQLYRREGFHNYRDVKGDFEAELVTVEDDGHLVLRDKAGNLRSYAFKEVQFVI